MSSGPAIWDFRARLNIGTVGAQSQASVRDRTVRIRYYFVHVLDIYLRHLLSQDLAVGKVLELRLQCCQIFRSGLVI